LIHPLDQHLGIESKVRRYINDFRQPATQRIVTPVLASRII